MIKVRLFVSFLIFDFLTACGLLDRNKDDIEITNELETLPEEDTQAPSILIDDQEMMPDDSVTYTDDNSLTRSEQITAETSGTFVGQKIIPLRDDYEAVIEAFNIHRDSYEEVK